MMKKWKEAKKKTMVILNSYNNTTMTLTLQLNNTHKKKDPSHSTFLVLYH